jgi:uncharacterized protein (TIGR02270 family)
MIVSTVIQQHADDATALAAHRTALLEGPAATLQRLQRFDRRLAAHLEGLRIAGDEGWALCQAALESPSSGGLFVVTVRALEDQDPARLDQVIAVAQAVEPACAGLLAAAEWMDPRGLRGTVARLLRDADGFKRMLGVAACAMHRVDPGIADGRYLADPETLVRTRALRAAGELGTVDLAPSCAALAAASDQPDRVWAAWSAVLLGDRGRGLAALTEQGQSKGTHRALAFRLALLAMKPAGGHQLLKQLAQEPAEWRWLLEGSGLSGDIRYVPWLIRQMADLRMARLAGEAFALITGADLPQESLDRPAPEDFVSGPTDDPDDPDVGVDPDDDLPWPHAAKIDAWWTAHRGRFVEGERYFMGQPPTRQHCVQVLKTGYQRQRILAAQHLCLLEPGTPLFNTAAPASRQARLLAQMA